MMKKIVTFLLVICIVNIVTAQSKRGIHFQGIARSENGMIIANKQITLRISILKDSSITNIEYQEIKSVTTNVLGLFYTTIGMEEPGKLVTMGSFEFIQWQEDDKYMQVEVDPNNSLRFLQSGFQKINYVPYALYASQAKSITTILPLELGGTGASNKMDVLKSLGLEKVNNTPDSLKPASALVNTALNEKLKKVDTLTLSNRINGKLNSTDTIKLSNRINLKLNSLDTINLSNRINALSNLQSENYYGFFYDTTKQIASISTATSVRFGFQQMANKISVANNTANNPTRISFSAAGVYQVHYNLQFIKSDIGTDEVSIWFRKNSAAIANTNITYTIQGLGIKNNITNNFLFDIATGDYIELYFSVKNINTALQGTVSTAVTPSRPATPAASISIHSVN